MGPRSRSEPIGIALRDLVNVLVHDVKNPLSSMVTNAQFLRDEAVNDDARAAAEDVLAAAEWVNRMLSNLSDIARFADDDVEGTDGQSNLVPLLERAQRTMAIHARDRDVELALGVHQDTLSVVGDGELLLRLCETIMEACIRHAPKASTVVISAGTTKTGAEISFCCNGTPLEADEREMMFTEEAFLGENSSRLRLAPTFGLAFSRRAARALGGDLVADAAQAGLRIKLTLPSISS